MKFTLNVIRCDCLINVSFLGGVSCDTLIFLEYPWKLAAFIKLLAWKKILPRTKSWHQLLVVRIKESEWFCDGLFTEIYWIKKLSSKTNQLLRVKCHFCYLDNPGHKDLLLRTADKNENILNQDFLGLGANCPPGIRHLQKVQKQYRLAPGICGNARFNIYSLA